MRKRIDIMYYYFMIKANKYKIYVKVLTLYSYNRLDNNTHETLQTFKRPAWILFVSILSIKM